MTVKFPFYVRLSLVLLSICLFLLLIYIGKHILIPVLLSFLFAILLRPTVAFFNRKLPHLLSVLLTLLSALALLIGIIAFVSWQIGDVAQDWIKIKHNFETHFHNLQNWIKQRFHISYKAQNKYILDAGHDSLSGKSIIEITLNSFTDVLFNIILIPFYTFLILLYRNLFIKFLSKCYSAERQDKLQAVLSQVKLAVQGYLRGLLIQMAIVSTLTGAGLMIIGIEYAVLLGVLTGILNLIPYLGIMAAAILSIFATLSTSADVTVIAGVITVNIIVQLIDNNFVVPVLVGSKVKINALACIISVVIGGALAGVAGMFLAIPTIAILKVVFDNIENLEPIGFIMGDDLPGPMEWKKKKPGNNKGETVYKTASKNANP